MIIAHIIAKSADCIAKRDAFLNEQKVKSHPQEGPEKCGKLIETVAHEHVDVRKAHKVAKDVQSNGREDGIGLQEKGRSVHAKNERIAYLQQGRIGGDGVAAFELLEEVMVRVRQSKEDRRKDADHHAT